MGREATKKMGLIKRERLTRRGDFDATYRARNSAADSHLILYVRPNGLAFSRIGLSVAGKWGNACRRNTFRRRCREAFRLHKHDIPAGFDIIVIPRRGIDLSLDEVSTSLVKLSRKLAARKMEPNS
ncbi:MAG TPA: ribonuclease P protein component [Planctomycetota bacterium]|nr:ribonuclease P protein component [Planctomycetota bacterium]